MAKEQTLVVASPFKFGFFAGLGFFFASVLMSGVTFAFFAILGLGTLGALLKATQGSVEPHWKEVSKTAMATSDGR